MSVLMIGPEAERLLTWPGLCAALQAGHRQPRAEIGDTILSRRSDVLLSRSAWIDGIGLAVKSATVFPGNKALGKPAVNGAVSLYSDQSGELEAIVDFHLVTKWKTAGDSLLAASLLARPDSRSILLVGAGTVARSMVDAYRSRFPGAQFTVWNRSPAAAETMAREVPGLAVATDLADAVAGADIICTATMATEPLIRGGWLRPGTHLDLIGAYRPDMREVDDETLRRSRIFVDARATTLHHIGELKGPLDRGVIAEADVIADYYDIAAGRFARRNPTEITLAKNGGGAHLDLMVARYVMAMWQAAQG